MKITVEDLLKKREQLKNAYKDCTGNTFIILSYQNNENYRALKDLIFDKTGKNISTGTLLKFLNRDISDNEESDIINFHSNTIDIIDEFILASSKSTKQNFQAEIDNEVFSFLKKLRLRIKTGKHEGLKKLYEVGVNLADKKQDKLGIAYLQLEYSKVIVFDDVSEVDILIRDSLSVMQTYNLTDEVLDLKHRLYLVKIKLGELAEASVLAEATLALAREADSISYIAYALLHCASSEFAKGNLKQAQELIDNSLQAGTTWEQREPENAQLPDLRAGCYQLKYTIANQQGNYKEAKAYLLKAIEEGKKIAPNTLLLAKSMLEVAELELAIGDGDHLEGLKSLEGAIPIFIKHLDWDSYTDSVIVFTHMTLIMGNNEMAYESLCKALEVLSPIDEQEFNVCRLYIEAGDYFMLLNKLDKAYGNYDYALAIAEKHTFKSIILTSVLGLIQVANLRSDTKLRDLYIKQILPLLYEEEKKPLSESERATLNLHFGELFFSQDYYEGALQYYSTASKQFKALENSKDYFSSLFYCGLCHFYLRNKADAIKTLKKVYDLTAGKQYFLIAFKVRTFCAYYFFLQADYEMSKRYFKEAVYLAKKHSLQSFNLYGILLYELGNIEKIVSPNSTCTSFEVLIRRLFDGVATLKKRKLPVNPYIRFWFFTHFVCVWKHYYHSSGTKSALFINDVNSAKQLSTSLAWLFDFFFVFLPSSPEKGDHDLFVFPFNDLLKDEAVIKNSSQNAVEFVQRVIDDISDTTSNETKYSASKTDEDWVVRGFAYELPHRLYRFIRTMTADDVFNKNLFISIGEEKWEPGTGHPSIFSWMNNECIAVFVNEQPPYKTVAQIDTFISMTDPENVSKCIEAKKLLYSLMNVTEPTAKVVLENFKLDWGQLFNYKDTDVIACSFMIVKVEFLLTDKICPVLVIYPDN